MRNPVQMLRIVNRSMKRPPPVTFLNRAYTSDVINTRAMDDNNTFLLTRSTSPATLVIRGSTNDNVYQLGKSTISRALIATLKVSSHFPSILDSLYSI